MIKKLKYNKWKKIIEKSGLFDIKYYLFSYPDVRQQDIDPIMHYIKYGVKEEKNPSEEFDTNFYLYSNKDIDINKINPLVHFILHGCNEKRICNKKSVLSEEKMLIELIDELNLVEGKIEMLSFIKNKLERIEVKGVFSSEDYLELYPDLKAANINPLVHYLMHGKKEGRIPFIDIENHFFSAKKSFDVKKETILLVSHESSATGAPLLGLNIGKKLTEKYNLIHYVMRKSNIHDIFYDDCFLLIEGFDEKYPLVGKKIIEKINNQYNIKSVVCNSIVTYPILQIASDLKIPTLSLIHEFSEYTKPKDRMLNNIIAADSVILPAKIIQNSIMEQLNEIAGISTIPTNIHIYPQGKLPFLPTSYGDIDTAEQILKKLEIKNKNDYKIIVATGYAQIRKGVDLFIYTAKYIKNYYKGKCKFVWVGDGFNPESDFSYCLWLEREIKHLGLEDDFVFLEHQQNLDAIFSISDIFCLTSRMDPFPNVVIDALEANLPIACFRDASGSVEFLEENSADCIIAEYLDTHQLGKMISDYLTEKKLNNNINSSLVKEKLDFDKYMQFLFDQIDESYKFNFKNQEILNILEKSEYFDNEYVSLFQEKSKSIYYYILLNQKGLHRMNPNPNPNPGFSNLKYITDNNIDNIVPLYDAINTIRYTTHECKIVPFFEKNDLTFKFAIHLHLYYVDLADEFCNYFKNLPMGFDLFITIIDKENIDNVYRRFKNCGALNIEVIVVKNIGRDIGPMIFDLKNKILNGKYDVIGHFHSKKSISTDNQMGNRWRSYLLDNLMGNNEISRSVLSLFNDATVGLIFAEDRHYMDIGDNKKYLDDLCKTMNIDKINEAPLFPLGNMFWARIDAIKDMFELDKSKLLQEEPLPYDGSYMHALERITPSLVIKNNYKYITIYKKGTSW